MSILSLKNRKPVEGVLGIGVIGAGNFAQSMLLPHLKNRPDCAMITVVTQTPIKSRDVAERFGFANCSTDPQQIFSDQNIQAVMIATRHDSHANLAIQALQAGKAIHLEKPMALTPAELSEIIKVYQEKSIASEPGNPPFLMLGFNRRFAPMVQRAAKFLSGSNEPLTLNYRINAGLIARDHWTQDPEVGGGRIIGEVCHFIDLLQFFTGSRIHRIFAEQMPDQGKYRQDNIAISCSLEDGSVGTILYIANGDRGMPKEYIEIYRAGKVAVLQDYSSLTLVHSGKKNVIKEGARDKGHHGEVLAWLKAIQLSEPEPVPFSMAVAATRATFAVLESIKTCQAVLLPND